MASMLAALPAAGLTISLEVPQRSLAEGRE
jgi:hypothetical protein